MIKVTTPECMVCGKAGTMSVPEEGLRRWQGGELIQVALPDVPADEREQLKTGTHPACWGEMFSNEED